MKSSIGLGISFDFFFFLNRIAILVVFGSLHEFIGKTLGDILGVFETFVSGVLGDEIEGLVNSSERTDVDGLSLDITTFSDSGGVFSGSAVSDGIDNNLNGVFSGLEVDDFEGLSDDSHGLQFFTRVSSVEHHAPDESFDDGHRSLSEFLDLVSSSSVGQIDSRFRGVDGDVILYGHVRDLQVIVCPLGE